MPGGTTCDDDNAVCILKLVFIIPETTEHQSSCPGIQSSAHAISNGFSLFVDLFQHEMLVTALFYGLQFHLQLVDIGIGFNVFNGLDLEFVVSDDGYFKVIQVYHLIGVLDDRRGIRGQKVSILSYPD